MLSVFMCHNRTVEKEAKEMVKKKKFLKNHCRKKSYSVKQIK